MKKRWRQILMVPVVLGMIYVGWQYLSISAYASEIQPVRSDVIIVLGAEVRGEELSGALRERCDWAYQMYSEGYADKLILSGGLGNGMISEAEAMRRYLSKKGVPDGAMLLEDASRSTRENLENSKQIMEREQMQTAIICTHLFHQKRAAVLSEQLAMQTSGYGQPASMMFEPYWMIRETLALLKVYAGK